MAFGWASKYIIWYFTWAWDHSEKSFWLGAVLAVVQVVRLCAIVQFLQYPLGIPGKKCAIISHTGHSHVQLFQTVI